jgi:outer membrane protein OmpA-like peptidoglycan-associated protein
MPSGRPRSRIVFAPLLMAAIAWSWTAPAVADDRLQGAQDATNGQASNLDDFTPVKSITFYFGDGKFSLSKDQRSQLEQLAKQVQGIDGYMISVAASASDIGSETNNQKLSMQRAYVVATILRQNGVPPAHLIVSAAPGVSEHAAPGPASKGPSENRRAVVTLLRNK